MTLWPGRRALCARAAEDGAAVHLPVIRHRLPAARRSVPDCRPDLAIGGQAERFAPERCLCEYPVRGADPILPYLMEKAGPAERAQDLNVETAHDGVEAILGSRVAVENPAEIATGDAVVGFDVQHIEKDVPIAERALWSPREPQVVRFKQIERRDDAEDRPG